MTPPRPLACAAHATPLLRRACCWLLGGRGALAVPAPCCVCVAVCAPLLYCTTVPRIPPAGFVDCMTHQCSCSIAAGYISTARVLALVCACAFRVCTTAWFGRCVACRGGAHHLHSSPWVQVAALRAPQLRVSPVACAPREGGCPRAHAMQHSTRHGPGIRSSEAQTACERQLQHAAACGRCCSQLVACAGVAAEVWAVAGPWAWVHAGRLALLVGRTSRQGVAVCVCLCVLGCTTPSQRARVTSGVAARLLVPTVSGGSCVVVWQQGTHCRCTHLLPMLSLHHFFKHHIRRRRLQCVPQRSVIDRQWWRTLHMVCRCVQRRPAETHCEPRRCVLCGVSDDERPMLLCDLQPKMFQVQRRQAARPKQATPGWRAGGWPNGSRHGCPDGTLQPIKATDHDPPYATTKCRSQT
jgi:hypothetical protein